MGGKKSNIYFKDITKLTENTCTNCNTSKPVDEFYVTRTKWRDHQLVINSQCKACIAKKHKEYYNKTKVERKTQNNNVRIKSRYNITLDTVEEMYNIQGGCCEICKVQLELNGIRGYCIDHCHKTNKVRGLLCSSCNKGIGSLKESKEILKNAIKYLEKYEEVLVNTVI